MSLSLSERTTLSLTLAEWISLLLSLSLSEWALSLSLSERTTLSLTLAEWISLLLSLSLIREGIRIIKSLRISCILTREGIIVGPARLIILKRATSGGSVILKGTSGG